MVHGPTLHFCAGEGHDASGSLGLRGISPRLVCAAGLGAMPVAAAGLWSLGEAAGSTQASGHEEVAQGEQKFFLI